MKDTDPTKSARDIARRFNQLANGDGEEEQIDNTKAWRAFIEGRNPKELDSKKEANQVRKWWCFAYPLADTEDVEDLSEEEIETFDDWIERSEPPL